METITIRSVWVKFYSAWRILICVEKKKNEAKHAVYENAVSLIPALFNPIFNPSNPVGVHC